MNRGLRKNIFRIILAAMALAVLFTPLYMYFSHDVAVLNSEWPHRVKEGGRFRYEMKGGKPPFWAGLKEISKYAKGAIVISEDWAFYQHEGIDVEQIKVALNEMMKENRFRGASTITQQMLKNTFLSEERTLWRKVHEIILARKVEKVMKKDRILEIYLNVIEFGPSIFGIREASYHYFKKHPSALTPREGAFLAMLLPSPKRYYESFKKKRLTPFALSRVNTILTKMRIGKVITPDQYQEEKNSRFFWEK